MNIDLAVLLDNLVDNPHDEVLKERAADALASQPSTPGQRRAFEIVLAGEDVFQLLEDEPERVRVVLSKFPEDLWHVAPAAGEWSAAQVVHHLADNEAVNAVRLRSMLTEDEPEIFGYDSDPWTRFFDLEPVEDALVRFAVQRRNTVRLIRSLTHEDLGRRGILSYRGAESVRVLLAVLAGHDRDHRGQVDDALWAARA